MLLQPAGPGALPREPPGRGKSSPSRPVLQTGSNRSAPPETGWYRSLRSRAAGTRWAHLSRAHPGICDPGPAPRPAHRAASRRLCRSRAGPRGAGDSALPLLQPPPRQPGFCSAPPAPASARSWTQDPATSRPAGDPAIQPSLLTSASAAAPRRGPKSGRLPACCLPSRWPAALPPPSAHPRGPGAHSPAPAPARPGRGVEADVR